MTQSGSVLALCCMLLLQWATPSTATNATLLSFFSLSQFNETGGREATSESFLIDAGMAFIAIDHVNSRNGSIVPEVADLTCDVNLNLFLCDSLTEYAQTLEQYFSFIDATTEGPDFVVGPFRSSSTIPVSFVSSVQMVPVVGYSATSLDLDDATSHPFFTRTIPSDSGVAASIVALINSYGYEYAAVLYVDDAYGRTYKDALFEEAQQFDIDLRLFPYDELDEDSIESALDDIVKVKLNVVVSLVFNSNFDDILLKAAERELIGEDRLFIFSDSIGSVATKAAENVEVARVLNGTWQVIPEGGVIGTDNYNRFLQEFPMFDSYVDELNKFLPGGINSFPKNNTFDDTFVVQADSDLFSGASELPYFGLYAYDAILSIAFAIEQNCDLFINNRSFFNYRDIITAPGFMFNGITGSVSYNEVGSRDLNSATVIVDNFLFSEDGQEFSRVRGGRWFDNEWTLEDSLVFPPGDSKTAPLFTDLPDEKKNNVSMFQRVATFCFAGLVVLSGFIALGWLYANVRNGIIRAQQPEFLVVIAMGAIISTGGVFFFGWDEDSFSAEALNAGCTISIGFISIGQTLIISGFTLKLLRIYNIFKSTETLQKRKVPVLRLLLLLGGLVCVHIFVLGVWSFVSPLAYTRVVIKKDPYEQSLESYGVCRDTAGLSYVFLIIIGSMHFLQYSAAIRMGYKSAFVPPDFQDTRFVAMSCFIQVQLIMLGVPIVLGVDEQTADIRFIALGLILSLSNLSVIVLMFLPKAYRMVDGPKKAQFSRTSKSYEGNSTTSYGNRISKDMHTPNYRNGTTIMDSLDS